MDGTRRTKRLMDFLDEYPDPARTVAIEILKAELGKLHLQNPRHIKDEIRHIIEHEAAKVELGGPDDEA
jgi:hypothetical protein